SKVFLVLFVHKENSTLKPKGQSTENRSILIESKNRRKSREREDDERKKCLSFRRETGITKNNCL
ncbi:hypothetical protein, partial [uncultured Rikenella sp.]|uniref:hypothetical protein n=1 Tax=uncultured Rikenella sp. TaxID=368003 RepID=UPI0025DCC521